MKHFGLAALIASLLFSCAAVAQSNDAAITGRIDDPSKALIANATVTVINVDTGGKTATHTNGSGQYALSALVPGNYRIEVDKQGFQSIIESGVILHTQDIVQFNFHMVLGSSSESVTVNADENNINTTDATVGTVIDRQFVEEIPLNGRSFQSLILLSPGVVTTTPQSGITHPQGQFSVNGQTADANNFTLDGASASNTSSSINGGAGAAGSSFNATTLGTTQGIISIDALQEFRIATSTYSAEYGRQPGAQVSFTSRSGTNEYHGTAFDYLRNSAFDANNWFNGYSTSPVPKPAERQNDFGGVFGGPLGLPKLLSGKDRAFFFFFSYEGLRLSQPSALQITYVPSAGNFNTATNYASPLDKNLRANAAASLQPLLNSFPMPNCSVAQDPLCVDYGDGLLPFIYSQSNTGILNALGARIDFQVLPGTRLFARYSDSESSGLSDPSSASRSRSNIRTRIFLFGVDSSITASTTNQLRLQYSPSVSSSQNGPTSVGGAQPANWNVLQGMPPIGGETSVTFGTASDNNNSNEYVQLSYGSSQFQPNALDTVTWQHGVHLFKGGVDYRQTTNYYGRGSLSRSPWNAYVYDTAAQIRANAPYTATALNIYRQDPTFKNLGVFFQDEWRLRPRFSLSMGLRWDLNPPPALSGAPLYTYTGNISDPASLALAPEGTPAYKTAYSNFAPRLGVAIAIHNNPGSELVFRAGGGLFYDTGQASSLHVYGQGSGLGNGYEQYFGSHYNVPQPFPIPASVYSTAAPPNAAPYALGYLPENDFHPPSAIHWNVSLEQAVGRAQSFTLSYVGSTGRDIPHWTTVNPSSTSIPAAQRNTSFSSFEVYSNGPGSDYNSLQLQYKRQPIHGLQVLASYTWSHAIDWNSTDYWTQLNLQRGNSDNDVRNSLTTAAVYNLPSRYENRWERQILGYWNLDLRFTARSGFPVNLAGPNATNTVNGETYVTILNYNGMNPYINKPGIPGGRQYNPGVFSVALASQNGQGNLPRNFLRGFSETQADTAVQRTFALYERWRLQFRAEAFNLFNHPTFGSINVTCGTSTAGAVCTNPLLGEATNTLNNSLVGLSSLYQQGGPRSLQFALKLQF
jgi:Carboxypeptidase regulatory-like domain